MEVENADVRHADASVLIGNVLENPVESKTLSPHHVIQSDRGPWQVSHWLIFMLTAVCCCWQTFSPAFLVPASSCRPFNLDTENASVRSRSTNNTPWYTADILHEVNDCHTLSKISNCSWGNVSSASSIQDITFAKCKLIGKNDEHSDSAYKWTTIKEARCFVILAKSLFMLGSFVAAILAHFLVKRLGQRSTVLCGFLSFYLCSVGACLTSSEGVFLLLRFLLSVGITSVYWITQEAMMDSVTSHYRLIYGATGHLGWAMGYMILPIVAWYSTGWIAFQAYVSAPCLLLAVPLCFLPESFNYLLCRGKVNEAVEALKAALKKNGRSSDDVIHICHQSHRNFMKRSDSKQTVLLKLKAYLECRNLLFYASSFMISLLYYTFSWNFHLLPGDPFINFAWAGSMETLSVLLLIFFGYFLGQRILLVLLAMGAGGFPLIGVLIAGEKTWLPVNMYMAAKFSATGALVLTFLRGFEGPSLTVTAVVTSIGAAVAPLLQEMVVNENNLTPVTASCIICIISAILSALFPSHSTRLLFT